MPKLILNQKILLLCIASFGFTGCSLEPNQSSQSALTQPQQQNWLKDQASIEKTQSGLTAFLALNDAFLSIATRIHLIHHAQHSLDLQYYIWEDDSIGHLMLAELLKAADRGVKIRLMIDDQNGTQLDDDLKTLAEHPNFEIKLFNPYKFRHFRAFDYAFRLKHINHRMHNKLIIADGIVAVTGGRNISREYFDASENFQFTDMDIFFAGHAVLEANQVFHQFWNDELSYPVQQLVGKSSEQALNQIRQRYAQPFFATDEHTEHKIKMAQREIANQLEHRPIQWAKSHFLADTPDKIRGKAAYDQLIYNQILNKMGTPDQHMELVSAYFVPTQQGADYLSNLSKNGVKVRVLTNSFLANDVALVHAFYQKYRTQLLKNGVKLYEFKPYIEREKRTWYEVMTGNVIPAKGKNASSLHAKFFDIDGKVFIGSFNFDPRSAKLNTEVGLVIESDALQNEITTSLDQFMPQVAYELQLDQNGQIIWLDHQKNGDTQIYKQDPETTAFQRFMIQTISYLPIEWMM